MQKKILNHPVDVWPVLLVASVFASQLAVYFYVTDLWLALVAIVFLSPFFTSVVAYNHNHIHTRTFAIRPLNRIFEIMMFFETGSSPLSGALNHILGHHATYFKPEQDTLNWERPDGSMMGRHEFALKKALHHYPSCWIFGKQNKWLFKHFAAYLVICLSILAVLIVYKPLSALIAFVLPMMAMLYVLKWGAYNHHSGLPLGDDYTASRTHTGRFYNWATWNAGYHAAHHFQQALHWSRLPEYHRGLASKIPQDLQGDRWGKQALYKISNSLQGD